MRRKWLEIAQWHGKQENAGSGTNNNADRANSADVAGANGGRSRENPPLAEPPPAKTRSEQQPAGFHVELLGMEDIYRAAGILEPRRGYSIQKIVEMLRSDHLRGQSKEIKRAAVLMALEAAGVSVNEVLRDAETRQEAIDAYEAEQRKQVEAEWARKAEENLQLQAELERVKAQYMDRLRRNLDGVAREKVTFGSWLTMKQQEGQSMAEAAELCSKPAAPEASRENLTVAGLAEASSKPV